MSKNKKKLDVIFPPFKAMPAGVRSMLVMYTDVVSVRAAGGRFTDAAEKNIAVLHGCLVVGGMQ